MHVGPGPTRAPAHKTTLWLRLHPHRGLAISLATPMSTVALVHSSPRSINLSPTQEQPERGGYSPVMKTRTAEMPCQMAAVTSESRNLLLGIFSFQVPEPAQTLSCLSKAAALLPSLALGQVVLALPANKVFFSFSFFLFFWCRAQEVYSEII